MKQRGLYVLITVFLISLSFVAAQNDTAIENAYNCLQDKVEDNCDSLTLDQQIFSLLTIGECRSEVLDSDINDECWPDTGCELKRTAQAILALNENNINTDDEEDWLYSQTGAPTNLEWFLQIESDEATECDITYSGFSYDVGIGEDKKIDSEAGTCLSLATAYGNYWLEIDDSCHNIKFEISCDEDFFTNLLFKEEDSPTIYVADETHFANAGETTEEEVNSLCFEQNSVCNYEGSLWAAWILDSLDYDISAFMPYLITQYDDYEEYIPESFLYMLGYNEYKNALLLNQKNNQYWEESGDEFYDTAVAMLSLYYDSEPAKENTKEWLLDSQDSEGCWQGDVRDTAFILYAVWPEYAPSRPLEGGGTESADCKNSGYYCMSEKYCSGQVLQEYSCTGFGYVCCSIPKSSETCAEQGGEICSSDEVCKGTSVDASNIGSGEICCIDGYCKEPDGTSETTECELHNGVCRSSGCFSSEEEADYDCDYYSETCCVEKEEEKNLLWIWILIILIFLSLIGILFRDKLRKLLIRVKSGFGKSKPSSGSNRPSSFPPSSLIRRPPMRPVSQGSSRPPLRRKPGELDSVLKKLKDMGK